MPRKGQRLGPYRRRGGKHVSRRRCLGCGDRFKSEGPWHRMCDKCKQRKSFG